MNPKKYLILLEQSESNHRDERIATKDDGLLIRKAREITWKYSQPQSVEQLRIKVNVTSESMVTHKLMKHLTNQDMNSYFQM